MNSLKKSASPQNHYLKTSTGSTWSRQGNSWKSQTMASPPFVNVFTAAAMGMVVIHEYTKLKSQIEQQREKITDATDTMLLQTQNMRKLMQKQGVEIPEVNELISQLLVVVTALSTHNTLAEKNIE
ncbi:hypothetical protein IH980_04320 [Patescibacteria group bacterium]|nr:hypothetical protein [Patescibacteria group bacterium]